MSLCKSLLSVIRPSAYNILFLNPFVTKYYRDPFMVSCFWSNGLMVHVQFLSSLDTMGPIRGTLSIFFQSQSMRLSCFIIDLFCEIHNQDMHVPILSSQDALRPKNKNCLKTPFLLIRSKLFVLDRTNA